MKISAPPPKAFRSAEGVFMRTLSPPPRAPWSRFGSAGSGSVVRAGASVAGPARLPGRGLFDDRTGRPSCL